MFERLKDCADRINDQLGSHKASARSGSVERHRALRKVVLVLLLISGFVFVVSEFRTTLPG